MRDMPYVYRSEVYGREEMRYGTVRHGAIRYDPGSCAVRACVLAAVRTGVCKRTERDFVALRRRAGGTGSRSCSRFSSPHAGSRGEATARPRFGAAAATAKVTRRGTGTGGLGSSEVNQRTYLAAVGAGPLPFPWID